MKTIIKCCLTALFLALVLVVFGQTENQQKSSSINFSMLDTYVPGKLIFKNGDVLEKTIKYDNPEELKKLDGTIYYNEPGQMARASVSKSSLEAFEIDGHLWKRITHKGDEEFGIMHIDGAIQYYSIFRIPTARVTGDYQEQSYIKKLDGEPISIGIVTVKYRKTMLELVSDYDEMAMKITTKESGYKNFLTFKKVIKEYNDWYTLNHDE